MRQLRGAVVWCKVKDKNKTTLIVIADADLELVPRFTQRTCEVCDNSVDKGFVNLCDVRIAQPE